MKRIYLDYAALTPIDPRVQREMNKYSKEPLNPSSIHSLGVMAKKTLDTARKSVADFIHAHPDEIIFNSGGTEGNGLILEGVGRAAHRNGLPAQAGIEKPHIIISAIEHSSIIETANMLEKHGVEVTRLSVDKNGLISLEELKKAIKPSTYLVSIMTVNNETGVIQPVREIAKIVRDARKTLGSRSHIYPLLHTDASQALLSQDLNVEKLGVDFMTLDSSKAYGPRGCGAVYIKRGSPIEQIMYGGGQEKNLRSGTENIPAVIGFAKALGILNKDKESSRVADLRNYFEREILAIRPDVKINSSGAPRVPHISNITFPGIDAEMIVLRLDAAGILASTKSACLKDEDESYVLKAIGADSKSSIRFSFGRWTTRGELKKTISILKKYISKT